MAYNQTKKSMKNIFEQEVLVTISSYLIEKFPSLKEIKSLFLLSKCLRNSILMNQYLWMNFSSRLSPCGFCYRDSILAESYTLRKNKTYWYNNVRCLYALRKLKSQWRISTSSKLLINQAQLFDIKRFISCDELTQLLDNYLTKNYIHHSSGKHYSQLPCRHHLSSPIHEYCLDRITDWQRIYVRFAKDSVQSNHRNPMKFLSKIHKFNNANHSSNPSYDNINDINTCNGNSFLFCDTANKTLHFSTSLLSSEKNVKDRNSRTVSETYGKYYIHNYPLY